MGLFRYEEGSVVVDLELRLIPEYRILIAKDKDRFKKQALKEFAYIYFMYDYKSPYFIYEEEEREAKVRKECGLPKDWKIDSKLKNAINKYLELQETPTIKSLKAIKDSLITSSKVIKKLQQVIEKSLKNDEDGEDGFDITDIVDNVDRLLKLSEKLPSAINSLQQLEDKVKSEQGLNKKIRGGGEIGYFEE